MIFFIIKRKKGKFLGEILKMRYDNVDDFFIYSKGMVEDLSVVAFTIFYVNCRTSKLVDVLPCFLVFASIVVL